jgi:hypothetical protein
MPWTRGNFRVARYSGAKLCLVICPTSRPFASAARVPLSVNALASLYHGESFLVTCASYRDRCPDSGDINDCLVHTTYVDSHSTGSTLPPSVLPHIPNALEPPKGYNGRGRHMIGRCSALRPRGSTASSRHSCHWRACHFDIAYLVGSPISLPTD